MRDRIERGEPGRCVIVVNEALPAGRAANAAPVIALTLGKRRPGLAGPDLVDRSGVEHPGLIPIGIAVLGAPAAELGSLRAKALAHGMDVVDFPVQGQETIDYAAFSQATSEVETGALQYVGIGVYGSRRAVARLSADTARRDERCSAAVSNSTLQADRKIENTFQGDPSRRSRRHPESEDPPDFLLICAGG